MLTVFQFRSNDGLQMQMVSIERLFVFDKMWPETAVPRVDFRHVSTIYITVG